MESKKILVYGAGALGSLFAARLHQAGHHVSLLSRGQRLAELQQYGIVLINDQTGQENTTHLNVIDALHPQEAYELVMVIMRKNHVSAVLPTLAANQNTPNVLFLMNNAAGPGEFSAALGSERVMVGFPASAGARQGHMVRYLGDTAKRQIAIPFGEIDGQVRERTLMTAELLRSMDGYNAEIRNDMDAWLKTHVALLMPSIAPALFACGTDLKRMVQTRDALVLAVRAIREGFRVLTALHIPIVPPRMKRLGWLPEPLLIKFVERLLSQPEMEIGLAGHARAAPDEIKHLADEFLVLARQTNIPTPNIDRLYSYFNLALPRLSTGSAELSLDWRGVWIAGALTGGLITGSLLLNQRYKRRS
jgi:2-dehydropantoate 2-reductase